jgi:hypothetical protein
MKNLAVILLSVTLFGSSIGCSRKQLTDAAHANTYDQSVNRLNNATRNKMRIKVGSETFKATLFDNATASAFKGMLPLALEMEELNGNEKKYDLSSSLPTDSSNPKTINNGDLMIWGSNTLVLFYKTFPTQYSYTRLGKVDDPSRLETALGPGDVKVTFELE